KYLPLYLNAPLLAGAMVASLVNRSSKDEAIAKARGDRGILIASGLIAGAAILGVGRSLLASFAATKRFMDSLDFSTSLGGEAAEPLLNWLGLAAFLGLCALVYWDCLRAKPEKREG